MRFLTAASALVVLLAAPADGALTLNVESAEFRPGETAYVEVYASEQGLAEDENLVAYSIGLNLPQGGPIIFGPGPRVLAPQIYPYVFPPGTAIEDNGSNDYRVRASAAIPAGAENVSSGDGFLRVPVSYRPGYTGHCVAAPITFELLDGATALSDDRGEMIQFAAAPALLNALCPEPSSGAAALFGAGVFALRRRRRNALAAPPAA